MSLVPATITVNFTAQYVGPHRVCYRIVGDPSYTCTVPGGPGPGFHPICSGGGLPCSYDIPITVDNETCTQIDYEGYVQPACESETSLNGRVPFTVSFIPDPACNGYDVTCNDSPVGTIAVTAPGSGYVAGTFAVPLVGGGGTGATANAVIGNGEIKTISGDGAGTGYIDGVFTGVALLPIGGAGVGQTADITVAGGVLTVITLNNPGTGNITGDTFNPNPADMGGASPSVVEIITADTVKTVGELDEVSVTAPGSGYTSAPVVDLSGLAGGTGATATASLVGCSALIVYDCAGATATILPTGTLQPGETYKMCGPTLPSVPSDFSIVESSNCLCNCIEQDIQNTNPGGTINYTYIACNGSVVTGTLAGSASTGNVCMVDGSLSTIVNAPAVEAIVLVGPCSVV